MYQSKADDRADALECINESFFRDAYDEVTVLVKMAILFEHNGDFMRG